MASQIYDPQGDEFFKHGAIAGPTAIPLTTKEKAIMTVVNQLTDKVDWERKVFEEAIAEKWKNEAMAAPNSLITDKTWAWCIKELRLKADGFKSDQCVCVLDAEKRVVKSDTIISPELQNSLKDACRPLLESEDKDWHPGSDGKVLNLIHPSLYPLVYNHSLQLPKPMTSIDQALSLSSSGEVMVDFEMIPETSYGQDLSVYYSKQYQWLPCEVAFSGEDAVEIKSYINNLHPRRHKQLYSVLESFIGKAVPLFEKCLANRMEGSRRVPFRGPEEWDPPAAEEPPADREPRLSQEGSDDYDDDPDWNYWGGPEERQWRQTRRLIWPEPDWDAVDSEGKPAAKPWDHPKVDLRNDFKDEGLQVIVKLSSIELTPEKPSFDGGNWHLEGMQNEHIAATAIYYYDSDNITDTCIEFRQATTGSEFDDIEYEQGEWEGLAQIFDQDFDDTSTPCIERIGSVSTRAGRMIAFPNVLQHRVPGFELADPSKPGHRRILVLWLIEPHHRIKSTAEIAPQQRDWWLEEIEQHSSRLPAEVRKLVLDQVDWPMSRKEAEEHRLKLMAERTASIEAKEEEMREESFNFCEH